MTLRDKFYDPMFPVAAAILSLITWPIWALLLGSIEAANFATPAFALGVLALLLRASWKMADTTH